MSTPAKSFDDLRSILGKLDRKIDSARSKRLGLDDGPAEHNPSTGHEDDLPMVSDDVSDAGVDDNPTSNGRSPFGRAKPLNRNGPSTSNTWIGGAGTG